MPNLMVAFLSCHTDKTPAGLRKPPNADMTCRESQKRARDDVHVSILSTYNCREYTTHLLTKLLLVFTLIGKGT